jgi:hypothetical protein
MGYQKIKVDASFLTIEEELTCELIFNRDSGDICHKMLKRVYPAYKRAIKELRKADINVWREIKKRENQK